MSKLADMFNIEERLLLDADKIAPMMNLEDGFACRTFVRSFIEAAVVTTNLLATLARRKVRANLSDVYRLNQIVGLAVDGRRKAQVDDLAFVLNLLRRHDIVAAGDEHDAAGAEAFQRVFFIWRRMLSPRLAEDLNLEEREYPVLSLSMYWYRSIRTQCNEALSQLDSRPRQASLLRPRAILRGEIAKAASSKLRIVK